MRRRVDPERNADEDRKPEGRDGEDDRVWQGIADQCRDRQLAHEVAAEVALEGVLHEVPHLKRHRAVEIHLLSNDRGQLVACARAENDLDRVARDQVDE